MRDLSGAVCGSSYGQTGPWEEENNPAIRGGWVQEAHAVWAEKQKPHCGEHATFIFKQPS